jgi:hypothetical protein
MAKRTSIRGHVQALVDYVHLNPVRAGLIESGEGFDSWEWNSLQEDRKPPCERIAHGDRGMRNLKNRIVKILS